MVLAMSSPHRKNGGDAHDNDGGDAAYESNNQIKHVASSNLRRRHSAAIANRGKYRVASPERTDDRKSASSSSSGPVTVHALPKSLTPFIHVQDTEEIDAALDATLDAYSSTPSRTPSPEPGRPEADEEAPNIEEKTISYDQEDAFHASNLTTDSFNCNDYNNISQRSSSQRSIMFNDHGQLECSNRSRSSDHQKRKSLPDAPSVGNENDTSFRRERMKSYDSENADEHISSNFDNDDNNDNDDTHKTENSSRRGTKSMFAKFQQSRRYVGKMINNELIQALIIVLIVANGILMGVATTKWVMDNPEIRSRVKWIDDCFLYIFTVEIAMQLYYYGFALFLDSWLVFDLIVVGVSYFAIILTVFRSFRIFRVFRLVTRVKPLRDLILALGQVLPRMTAIMALLLITFYVFAVLFTELYSEFSEFESLHQSLFTCIQMMTMEWSVICRKIMKTKKSAWLPMVIFVAIAGFIVFNLIVAVVVEAVAATEETVRQLDGIESNTPASKLAEAQERVDLVQSHLAELMEQQEQIQHMLETMAGEVLHLETERMKAKHRENRLKEEISRRIDYEKKVEEGSADIKKAQVKDISLVFLRKIEKQKAERKQQQQQEENQTDSLHSGSEHGSSGPSAKKKKPKSNWTVVMPGAAREAISRDGSGKSLGALSTDSIKSGPDITDSPNQRSAKSARKKLDPSSLRTSIKKAGAKEGTTKTKDSDQKQQKAFSNWKKLLAVNKEINL